MSGIWYRTKSSKNMGGGGRQLGVDNQTHFLTRSRENEGGVTWGGSASPLDSNSYFLILPGIPVTHPWQALGTLSPPCLLLAGSRKGRSSPGGGGLEGFFCEWSGRP